MEQVIRAGWLIDGTGGPVRSNPRIRIAGGRIAAVAADPAGAGRLDDPPGDPALDFGEATILPGLIDSHVHLEFSPGPDHATVRAGFEGASAEQRLVTAIANAQQALRAGITTLRDLGGGGAAALAARDAFAAGQLAGPRVLAAGQPITTTGGHLHFCGLEADTADEVRKAARRVIRDGADWVKVVATGGIMTAGSNARAPQYTVEELRAAVAEAHRLGRRVASHTLSRPAIDRCVDAGVDTVEHCVWQDAAGQPAFDPRLADAMASRGIGVGYTVAGIARAELPPDGAGPEEAAAARERLRAAMAGYRATYAAGVRLMLSSDAGVRLTPFDEFWKSALVAVEGLGISPVEAIALATRNAAAGLGLDRDLGTVEVGKVADLCVVAGRPDLDARALARVRAVYQGGRLVVREGRIGLGLAGEG